MNFINNNSPGNKNIPNLQNTVYNNLPNDTIFKINDYSKLLKESHITFDFLDKHLDSNNPNLNTAKLIISNLIIENLEYITYCVNKQYLNNNDLYVMFLGLVATYDNTTNIEILNYLYTNANIYACTYYFVKSILVLFNKNIKDGLKFIDFFFKINENSTIELLCCLLKGINKNYIYEYILNNINIVFLHDHILLCEIIINLNLKQITELFENLQDIPYNKIIKYSIYNHDSNVFLYLNKNCDNTWITFDIILVCLIQKKFIITTYLLEKYTGLIDENKLIKLCIDSNDTELTKFIIKNIKIKNYDELIKYIKINENEELIQYLKE